MMKKKEATKEETMINEIKYELRRLIESYETGDEIFYGDWTDEEKEQNLLWQGRNGFKEGLELALSVIELKQVEAKIKELPRKTGEESYDTGNQKRN